MFVKFLSISITIFCLWFGFFNNVELVYDDSISSGLDAYLAIMLVFLVVFVLVHGFLILFFWNLELVIQFFIDKVLYFLRLLLFIILVLVLLKYILFFFEIEIPFFFLEFVSFIDAQRFFIKYVFAVLSILQGVLDSYLIESVSRSNRLYMFGQGSTYMAGASAKLKGILKFAPHAAVVCTGVGVSLGGVENYYNSYTAVDSRQCVHKASLFRSLHGGVFGRIPLSECKKEILDPVYELDKYVERVEFMYLKHQLQKKFLLTPVSLDLSKISSFQELKQIINTQSLMEQKINSKNVK